MWNTAPQRLVWIGVVGAMLVLAACGGERESSEIVVPVEPAIVGTSTLSLLAQEVNSANVLPKALVERGEPEGGYTLFAPQNATLHVALEEVGRDLDDVQVDKVLANQLLDIHLVGERLTVAALRERAGTVISTVSGGDLRVVVEQGTGLVTLETTDGTRVRLIATDVDAGTGIVHLIDAPLRVP